MFGIAAPRVAVRTAVAWYWRWLGLIALAVVIMMFSRTAYDFGRKFAGFDQSEADQELQRLTESKAKLEQEVAQISGNLAQIERQMQIERATYADLVKQVKALTEENASLKEDLAFFQTLMPSGGKEGGVAVNRFMVQNDALPGEFRYRLLLTQTGQRSKDFQGRLQFVVNLQQDGKKTVMTLPAEDDKEARGFKLNFRFYQRVEGTFRVTPGTVVKGMQVRVLEGDSKEPRLTQQANLS
ncbi:MAG: hypothetical protein EBT83_12085 [Betaproteobacteria bacterium]|nr:hypothetical protein [Betaproteobacteria bacterium]